MGLQDPKKLPPLVGFRDDPLKHFSREKPGWKLAALVVDRTPLILSRAAVIVIALLHQ
jgi:hypothetical protein